MSLFNYRQTQECGLLNTGLWAISLTLLPRSNLDPFNQYTEDQIWDSLERTHMKECVSVTEGGLCWDRGLGCGSAARCSFLLSGSFFSSNHPFFLLQWVAPLVKAHAIKSHHLSSSSRVHLEGGENYFPFILFWLHTYRISLSLPPPIHKFNKILKLVSQPHLPHCAWHIWPHTLHLLRIY